MNGTVEVECPKRPESRNSVAAFREPTVRELPQIKDKIAHCVEEGKRFYSFEFFPPKTEQGLLGLYERIARLSRLEPLFVDVTWGAGGSTSDLTLELSGNIQKFFGLDVAMHLTCTNMEEGMVDNALEEARKRGIRNIVSLRGDPPVGQEWRQCKDGFAHASDLVRHVRKVYGDYFCLIVAGYPEGHPAGLLDGKLTYEQELNYLKEKVDAGGDLIITQMFYDVDQFLRFVRDCRSIGIQVPILPGILPIQSYSGFKRMTGFCRTHVPEAVAETVERLKDDEEAVKNFGIEYGTEMCRRILNSKLSLGLHFYTLNLEKATVSILENLGLVPKFESVRALPWRPATIDGRRSEDVRPIFWANRPASYLLRTETWDDFPNGRWGDSRSPAYGELREHHLLGGGGLYTADQLERMREALGTPQNLHDVSAVFVKFLRGETKAPFPWASEPLANETNLIAAALERMNWQGFLTINSQPRVNGAPSTDVTVGWGGAGGYVYQKAYVEFFCSEERMIQLLDAVRGNTPEFGSLSIYAINSRGDLRTNVRKPRTNAVTWGIFPDREVIQPTVVCPESFKVWSKEAFALWKQNWSSIYDPENGTPEERRAYALIEHIRETFWLVNVVDNNFVTGDIFKLFARIG
jgi:methylenetetrahydrofolate reductase (NADPH)